MLHSLSFTFTLDISITVQSMSHTKWCVLHNISEENVPLLYSQQHSGKWPQSLRLTLNKYDTKINNSSLEAHPCQALAWGRFGNHHLNGPQPAFFFCAVSNQTNFALTSSTS